MRDGCHACHPGIDVNVWTLKEDDTVSLLVWRVVISGCGKAFCFVWKGDVAQESVEMLNSHWRCGLCWLLSYWVSVPDLPFSLWCGLGSASSIYPLPAGSLVDFSVESFQWRLKVWNMEEESLPLGIITWSCQGHCGKDSWFQFLGFVYFPTFQSNISNVCCSYGYHRLHIPLMS